MSSSCLNTMFASALGAKESSPVVIANTLSHAIVRGLILPGTQLRQDELARQFTVSQTPVREALKKLCSDGLAVAFPNKGVFVTEMSLGVALEITNLRALLECYALRNAIPRMTEKDLANAQDALAALSVAKDADSIVTFNSKLHTILYSPCRQERTLAIIESLRVSFERYLRFLWAGSGNLDHSNVEHEELFAQIRNRDVESAVSLLEKHIHYTGDRIVERLSGIRTTEEFMAIMQGQN